MKILAVLLTLLAPGASWAASPAPSAVALSPTGVSGQLLFSWSAVTIPAGVTGYQVYRASYSDLSVVTPYYVTNTSDLSTGLPDLQSEWYSVAADGSGNAVSQTISAAPYPSVPMPVALSGTGRSGELQLSWAALTLPAGVTGYQIYHASYPDLSLVTPFYVTSTTALSTGLVDGQNQWYALAGDFGGASKSPTVSAASLGSIPGPLALSGTGRSGELLFTWAAMTLPAGVTGYQVYRATYPDMTLVTPFYVTSTATLSTGLVDGQSNWFAVAGDYSGAFLSQTLSAASFVGAPAPLGTQAAPTGVSGQVLFSWSPVSVPAGITGYQVYQASYPDLSLVSPSYVTSTAKLSTGLVDGQSNWFSVAADLSGSARSVTLLASSTLSIPTALVLTPTGNSGELQFTWAALTVPAGISAYQVFRATYPDLSAVTPVHLLGTTLLSTGLTDGQTMWFSVAGDFSGSSQSQTVSAASYQSAPAPTGVTVTATGSSGQLLVSWSPVSAPAGITGYQVYYATFPALASVAPFYVTTTSYLTNWLQDGQTYWFDVAADRPGSPASVTVSAIPTNSAPAPANLSVTATGNSGQVVVSWSAVTSPPGITGYQLYRDVFSSVTSSTPVYVSATSYTVNGLSNGQTYWFAVAAALSGSALSPSQSVVPYAPPDAPAITVTALNYGAGINVQWTAAATHGFAVGAYRIEQVGPAGPPIEVTVTASMSQATLSLPCATALTLQVRALDLEGHTGTASAPQWIAFPCAPLAAPQALSFSALTLSWADTPASADPANHFEIRYATQPGGTDPLPNLDLSTTAGVVTATAGVVPLRQSRWYRVYTIDAGGLSSAGSNELGFLAPPAPPRTHPTRGQVELDWTSPGPASDFKLTGYQIYYASNLPLSPGLPGTYVQMAQDTGSGTVVHATISANVVDGIPYYFALSALGGDFAGTEGALGMTVSAQSGLSSPVITAFNQIQGGPLSIAWSTVDASPNTPANYSLNAASDALFSSVSVQAAVTGTAASITQPARPLSYWYVVLSDTANNTSNLSPTATLLYAPALAAPVVSVGLAANGRVDLTWTAVPDATEYQIYRATQGVTTTAALFGTQPTWIVAGTSFIDVRPANGQDNLYQVLARRRLSLAGSLEESPFSVTVVAQPGVAPGIPGAYVIFATAGGNQIGAYLTATARPTLDAVDLQWAPASLGSRLLSGYRVYQGNDFNSLTPVAVVAAISNTYSAQLLSYIAFVSNPLSYVFGVEAIDISGTVGLRVTGTPQAYSAWGPPLSPSAYVLGSAVHLAWSAPGQNGTYPLSGYRVFRRDRPGSPDNILAPSSVTSTSFIDSTAGSAQASNPSYGIAALDSLSLPGAVTRVGASFAPPPFSGSVPSAPSGVSAQTLTGSAGSILALIQWQANPDREAVSAYVVYRDGSVALTTSAITAVDISTTPGVNHVYLVQALNALGAGVSATAVPSPLSITPPQPWSVSGSTSVDATGSTVLAEHLQWSDLGVPVSLTSYTVYRSLGAFTGIGTATFLTETTSTSFADNGITPTAYVSYAVLGKMGSWQSTSPVAQLSMTLTAAPAAPVLISSAASSAGVTLAWQAQPQAKQYWVFRSSAPLGAIPDPGQRISVVQGTSTLDATANANFLQYYGITALNELGQGAATELTITPIPGAPSALTLTPGFGGSPEIILAWVAPPSAASYEISRATTPAAFSAGWATVTASPVTSTSAIDTTIVTNTAYYYQVRSFGLAFSTGNPVKGPVSAYLPALIPSGLRAQGGQGRIDLAWDGPALAQGVTGYALSVARWDSPTAQSLTLPAQPAAFSLMGLGEAEGVSFTLQALNSAGASGAASISAQANDVGPAPIPLSFSARVGFYETSSATVRVVLTWSPMGLGVGALFYRSSNPIPLSLAAGGASSPLYITGIPGINGQYVDTSVTAGQPYYYGLTALGLQGLPGAESLPSRTAPVIPFSFPGPVLLTVTAGLGRVDLQWSPPAYTGTYGLAATPYRLYRYANPTNLTSSAYLVLTPDAGFPLALTTTSYADTQVRNGTNYQYLMTVVDGSGQEQNAAETRVGIIPRGPLAPPAQVLAVAGDGSVSLRWLAYYQDTALNLKFNVYRRQAGQDYGPPVPSLHDVGPTSLQAFPSPITRTVLTLRDTSPELANGTLYCYSLTEVNDTGEGGKSNETCVIPYRPLLPVSPALNLLVTGKKDINLTWAPQQVSTTSYVSTYPLAGFRVYRSVDGGTTYTLLATLGLTVTAYTDTSTQFGAAYVYRVVPLDDHSNEGYSYSLANIVIPAALNAVLVFRNSFDPAAGESVPIQYSLLQPGHAWVRIYTLQGDYINTVFDEDISQASPDNPYLSQKKNWDGTNADGKTVASGVYLIHLEGPGYRANARVAVIK